MCERLCYFFIINSGNFSFMNEKVTGPRWATNTNGRSDTRRGPGRGPKPKYNEKRFFLKILKCW